MTRFLGLWRDGRQNVLRQQIAKYVLPLRGDNLADGSDICDLPGSYGDAGGRHKDVQPRHAATGKGYRVRNSPAVTPPRLCRVRGGISDQPGGPRC